MGGHGFKTLLSATLAAGIFASTPGYAQTNYPSGPIRIVVGLPPGGFPDTTTRFLAEALRKQFGQQILIENRPSAANAVAGLAVAKAKPDGYTLLAADSQMWGIMPFSFKSMPFDTFADFEAISMFATNSLYFSVSATLSGATTPDALFKLLAANPGKFNYGSAGVGSLHHLIIETLKDKARLNINHIPYKGASQILPAMAAGEVAVAVLSATGLRKYVEEGTIRMLAATGKTRSASYPNVPTFEEIGFKDMQFQGTMALFAPKGTPKAIVERLSAAVRTASQDPEFVKNLAVLSSEPASTTPEETLAWMKRDKDSLGAAAKLAGIQPQ